MRILQRVAAWLAYRAGARAEGVGTTGRPSYLTRAGGLVLLPRSMSAALLGQFYSNIPALKRSVAILSGFAGVPEFDLGNEKASDEFNRWTQEVPYGFVSIGLSQWIKDHIAQLLVYGYAVGEASIAPGRSEIDRVWSYSSPQIGFRTPDATGRLIVVQNQSYLGSVGLKELSDETTLTTTHDARGSNPYGESLFWSIPSVCQLWMDILHATRATWRRSGIPTFHVNWRPPEGLNDPQGAISETVMRAMESGFNEAMRSQVMDGIAKDFYTTGEAAVTVIGADGQLIDLQVSKRAIVEEIVVGTGIPPFLFGYQWATTERLSQQQAEMLTETINDLRREVSGALRKLALLRLRLAGIRATAVNLVWPTISLQDALEQARAAVSRAQAESVREKTGMALWRNGVFDQARYAEYVICQQDVARVMREPPAMPAPAGAPPAAVPMSGRAYREVLAEYPGLWRDHEGCCGTKLSADDPASLFPVEAPQYEGLRQEVERAWAAVQAEFATLRAQWFAAAALADPGKAVTLSAPQKRALDKAIADFMRRMAGDDRSREGFVRSDTEDGLLQQASFLAYRAGQQRGMELSRTQQNPEFTEAHRRALLEDVFARLTQDGQFRFELRLGEIRDEMVDALGRGDSPLAVARELGDDLDGYERGRLRTIVRTEMGIAGETAIGETYRAAGVARVHVIGDPNTDAACTVHIGREYVLIDAANLPLYHPNCFCSIVPILPEVAE